ncbi:MAG: aminotransferase class IV, partial [Planctomycetota bacterium]
MPELAYVNGTFCSLAEAKVSIEDRGFQFADGVYEVIVAYGDRLFRLQEHLARLGRSLESINLDLDLGEQALEEAIATGVSRAGFEETVVYLQITRGVASRSHVYAQENKPTVVATFKAKPRADAAAWERGLSVVTREDIRWARCYVKSIALLPNVLVKTEVQRRGYDDAIFLG